MHILEQRVTEEPKDGLLLLGVGGVHAEEGRRLSLQAAALPIDGPSIEAPGTEGAGEAATAGEGLSILGVRTKPSR